MTRAPVRLLRRKRSAFAEPVMLDVNEGRPGWLIEAQYIAKHGHAFPLGNSYPDCPVCAAEQAEEEK